MSGDLPKFQDWGIAAVHLLRGAIYVDDDKPWSLMLAHTATLEQYFARLGLRLVINEGEGMAYLRQLREDERPDGYDALPRLFRSARLSYGQTVLCVLLRDELRRFEETDVNNERCVVEQSVLLDQWKAFFPPDGDDVKLNRDLRAALRRLEKLSFVKALEGGLWEVRRILKARISAEQLESLRDQLASAVGGSGAGAQDGSEAAS